jgi:hypothetical protein
MTPNFRFCASRHNGISSTLLRLFGAIALIGLCALPARAQLVAGQPAITPPAPPPSPFAGVEVLLTPYLWGSWMDVTINPSNPRIPSASTQVGFNQILDHITWVPFMGAAEVRDGPFGVSLDYIHAPLKAGFSTHGIFFGGGTGGLTLDTGTAMFFYRPIIQSDQYVDVGIGVRAWGIDGDVNLNKALLPDFDISRGTSWADPLIGFRYHRDLGLGYGFTAYGDVGGFGVGAHIDWQLIGTIDYKVSSWVDLHAGFRSLNFTYSIPRAGADVEMKGPLFSATFRF